MKKRIVYLDFIRLFACFCVTTVHFNASVSGYDIYGSFAYNNSIVPSEWFGVYLGTLGVGLFFLISGVALEYSNPRIDNLKQFYKKRFLSIYPAFWIAFFISLCVEFWHIHSFPNVPIWHLVVSLAGFDGYAMVMGLPGTDFYQVGEWFLGCIIIIYIIYPVLSILLHKWPIPFLAVYTGIWVSMSLLGVDMNWFFMWAYYVVLGMAFYRFCDKTNIKKLWLFFIIMLMLRIVSDSVLQYAFRVFLTCAVFFILVASIGKSIERRIAIISPLLGRISALTYPAFLVHHRLIYYMAKPFDLVHFSNKTYLFLYIQYVLVSFFFAWVLLQAVNRIVSFRYRRLSN